MDAMEAENGAMSVSGTLRMTPDLHHAIHTLDELTQRSVALRDETRAPLRA